MIRVAASHALDEGNLLGDIPVRGAHDGAAVGSRRAEHTLELDGGNHVGIPAVSVFPLVPGVILVEAGRENDRPHLDPIHLGGNRVIDGLGLADIGADATPQTAPATQTSFGFLNGHLLGKTQLDLVEGLDSLRRFLLRHGNPGLLFDALPDVLHGKEGLFQFPSRLQVRAPEITVNGNRGPFPRCHGIDGHGRPRHQVPTREDTGEVGFQGQVIHDQGAPSGHPESKGFEKRRIRSLTDGRNYHVSVEHNFTPLYGNRPASARGVRIAETHSNHLDTRDLPTPTHNRDGRNKITDRNPFCQGLLDLFVIGGHLFPGPTVADLNRACPGPEGAARRIDGHIPAPDHNNVA